MLLVCFLFFYPSQCSSITFGPSTPNHHSTCALSTPFTFMATNENQTSLLLEEDLLDLSINEGQHEVFNELTLIGSIIFDRILNFRAVKAILLAAWNLGSFIQITALDRNLITCIFTKAEDRDRILNTGPWAVKGHIISFTIWSPTVSIEEIDFSRTPFWVQIHNLPPNRVNIDNAVKLGNFIGGFLELDESYKYPHKLKKFLRIRANVDNGVQLKTGIFIKREDGSSLWIQFRYERLSDFVFAVVNLGMVRICVERRLFKRTVWLTLDSHMVLG